MVLAIPYDADVLEQVLPDIADPQVSGRGVPAEPPGHPQTIGPDLFTGLRQVTRPLLAGLFPKRVVPGNRVGQVALRSIDVDPQDRSGQHAEILAVAVGIFLWPGITGPNVEVPVGSECQHATPVQVGGLGNLQQPPRLAAGIFPKIGGDRPFGNDR